MQKQGNSLSSVVSNLSIFSCKIGGFSKEQTLFMVDINDGDCAALYCGEVNSEKTSRQFVTDLNYPISLADSLP